MYQLANFDRAEFLAHYWQKKPLVIRNAFSEFDDPLDQHELAGLAQEDDVDARIVSEQHGEWQLHHGPFEHFDEFCVGRWSLLVQALDAYIPEADALMQAFNFIPNWRIDDLMASFSSPGAGVGPHLDQYDVFIIQGQGSRCWQVGLPGAYQERFPHPQLRQIDSFTPIIEEVLNPGDMIYIPPGHPHNGVAMDYCMNYSVGFRAPNSSELISGFADHLLDKHGAKQRYTDPELSLRAYAGEIQISEINKLKGLVEAALRSAEFEQFICSMGSQHGALEHIIGHQSGNFSEREIEQCIAHGSCFYRQPGIQPTWLAEQPHQRNFCFYVQAKPFKIARQFKDLVLPLLNSIQWQAEPGMTPSQLEALTPLLTELVNLGFWHLDSDEDGR